MRASLIRPPELRWVSSPTDHLEYVGGLWYMRENTNRLRLFMLPSVDPDPEDADRYRGIDRTTSEAAFGQVDWNFAADWTLSVGGRAASWNPTQSNLRIVSSTRG
jgi:outer membrane receptor protein involved in Fe transport